MSAKFWYLVIGFVMSCWIFDSANAQLEVGPPVRLPETVNTEFIDFSPSISADGLELYFSSTRPGGSFDTWVSRRESVTAQFGEPEFAVRGNHPSISTDGLSLFVNLGGDIYAYTRPDSETAWGDAERLGENVNTTQIERNAEISADGLTLYFDRSENAALPPLVFWSAHRESVFDEFGPAQRLDADFNDGTACCATLSADQLDIYFSSWRDGGQGSWDIWHSRRKSTTAPWGEISNMSVWNTSELEAGPSVSPDGSLVLFARAPAGDLFGDYDIWLSAGPLVEPVRGDFDGDGQLGIGDLQLLTSAVRDGLNSSEFDLNLDGLADQVDRTIWVEKIAKTFFGDANLDGVFDPSDFVRVFQSGEYEDDVAGNSDWSTGDWDGDGEFNSSDLVIAFQGGGFEQGTRQDLNAVPEPTGVPFFVLAWILHCVKRPTVRRKLDGRVYEPQLETIECPYSRARPDSGLSLSLYSEQRILRSLRNSMWLFRRD